MNNTMRLALVCLGIFLFQSCGEDPTGACYFTTMGAFLGQEYHYCYNWQYKDVCLDNLTHYDSWFVEGQCCQDGQGYETLNPDDC